MQGTGKDAFDRVTTRHSRLLAASTVAARDFPDADALPRIEKIPDNNLGHLLLLDYPWVAKAVWASAIALFNCRKAHKPPPWCFTAAGAIFLLISIPLLAVSGNAFVALFPAAIVAGLVFALISPDANRFVAELKADIVRKLLDGAIPDNISTLEQARNSSPWAICGDGRVRTERALVFFARDEADPLPGLGRLQVRELVVCPLKPEADRALHSTDELFPVVKQAIASTLASHSLPHVRSGPVVVVGVSNIAQSSPWLDADKAPLLSIDAAGLVASQVSGRDPSVSARLFSGVQILFEEHGTCATFLVRPYSTGSAAAAEIIIATLGPPSTSEQALRSNLQLHEYWRNRREKKLKSKPLVLPKGPIPLWARRVHALRAMKEERKDPFLPAPLGNRAEPKPFDRKLINDEAEAVASLRATTGDWVGRFTREENWRETRSLTITNDFFGSTECRASVRAFYEHLLRGILTAFEAQGYDISTYKDSSGQWTINVDRISQMVVGERIVLSDQEKSQASAAPAAGKAAATPRSPPRKAASSNENRNEHQAAHVADHR